MAWTPPDPGRLRQRVRFERRGEAENIGGVVRSGWAKLFEPRMVELLPARGGEAVQGDRLAGVSAWTLIVRQDIDTRRVTTDDRVVNVHNEAQAFAIRSILDLEGRGRWFVMTLELGGEDGQPS